MPEQYEEVVQRITAYYVAEAQAGKQPRLSDYLSRYVEHTAAIADFVAYYHAVEEPIPPLPTPERLDILSVHSRAVLERLQAMPACPPTLLRTRKGRGLSPRLLAHSLDLSSDLVLQLEQRQLDPTTIPCTLYKRLARRLGYPLAAIYSYLEQAPIRRLEAPLTCNDRLPGVAERPPAYPEYRNSFRSALDASNQLSVAQKASWYSTLARERL